MQKIDSSFDSISPSPISRRFFRDPILICTEKSGFEVYLPEAWNNLASRSCCLEEMSEGGPGSEQKLEVLGFLFLWQLINATVVLDLLSIS